MNGFQRKTLERASRNEYKLSSWELEFVESLLDKDEDYELSEKQNHIVNRLGEKV